MVKAEGGPDAFVRAVRCSIPNTADYAEARSIALTTIQHRLWDYAMQDVATFVSFLGARWAPIGADNDPHGLNANWVPNVLKLFKRS
jgi:hypothetical protein